MITEPYDDGFDYDVYLDVALPLAWAELIKLVGENHYDYKCKEAARQGGIVFGLVNVATWNNDPKRASPVNTMRLSWRDCDTMCKIMEQAHYHTPDERLVSSICTYLRAVMVRLDHRRKALFGIVS